VNYIIYFIAYSFLFSSVVYADIGPIKSSDVNRFLAAFTRSIVLIANQGTPGSFTYTDVMLNVHSHDAKYYILGELLKHKCGQQNVGVGSWA